MTVLYSWTALQFLEARRGMYGFDEDDPRHGTRSTDRSTVCIQFMRNCCSRHAEARSR